MKRAYWLILLSLLPLHEVAADSQRSNRVLVIGIDGVRPDALAVANSPHLDALAASGGFTDVAQAGAITVSGPSWSTILTGVVDEKHNVPDNSFSSPRFDRYPDFLTRLEDVRPDLRTASVVTWHPINKQIIGNADIEINADNDADTARMAALVLKEADPDVLFIHLDDVDGAGHSYSFDPEVAEYLNAIEKADAHVGEILEALRSRKTYSVEDWLIISTTDHGGGLPGDPRSHGMNTPTHRNVYMIATGGGIPPGTDLNSQCTLSDVAPSALQHLGVEVDSVWDLDGADLTWNEERRFLHFEKQGDLQPLFHPMTGLILGSGEVTISSSTRAAEIYYSLKDELITKGSLRYTEPLLVAEDAVISARVYDPPSGMYGSTMTVHYVVQDDLLEPKLPGDLSLSLVSGLRREVYRGRFSRLPDFSQLQLDNSSTSETITLNENDPIVMFAVVLSGYLHVKEDGVYNFFLTSDDGSALYIGDRKVVDNDGDHGSIERSGPVALKAGLHNLRIEYFQGFGGKDLSAAWEGPGFSKRPIDKEALFHEP